MKLKFVALIAICLLTMYACSEKGTQSTHTTPEVPAADTRYPVILDSDANNELDDQHAIAYMLFNSDIFDIKGITVNRTRSGGEVDQHLAEANRVVQLCGMAEKTPVLTGANGNFPEIRTTLKEPAYDGAEAVDFIIKHARAQQEGKLILIPIGKLTNIALALAKAPDIASRIRIVWLGSNYPEPGEYNQDNDTASMSYVLQQDVPFEMVTVRYGKDSGSDAVRISPEEVEQHMKGKGPVSSQAVEGRHGGTFTNFGDYAYDLFSHIDLHGDPPSRALFDVVAVAVIKNPNWGQASEIPCPRLVDNEWIEQPDNPRKITLWENFDSGGIIRDFYDRMEHYQLD